MGEWTLEKLGEWIEAGQWVADTLRKDMREHPFDHPNEDPPGP